MKRLIALCVFALCSILPAHAQTCPNGMLSGWKLQSVADNGWGYLGAGVCAVGANGRTFSSVEGALACFNTTSRFRQPSNGPWYIYERHTTGTASGGRRTLRVYFDLDANRDPVATASNIATLTPECIPPPTCGIPAGTWLSGMLSFEKDAQMCHQGCNVEPIRIASVPGMKDVYQYRSQGTLCGGQNDPELAVERPECDEINGYQVCRSDRPECFKVNNEEVCTSDAGGISGVACHDGECLYMPDDGVLKLPSGAEVGHRDSLSPHAPDTGEPGVKAPPDLEISDRLPLYYSENTYHYWSPATAAASTTNGGGSGEPCEGEDCEPGGEEPCEGEDCEPGGPGGECDPETENCGECDPQTQNCGECDPETEECGDGGGASFTAPKIAYKYGDVDGLIAGKRAEISEYLATMRQEASQMLQPATGLGQGAGAQLPCWSFQFAGQSASICPAEFSSELAIVGSVIMLLGALASAFILFR